MLQTLASLLLRDAIFVILVGIPIALLCYWKRATYAVLKRNFVGYFSNPTGYAFLCLFVLLTSFAAFWPHEFFNANLANLDQLNRFLPRIMLIFIPAITMSVWAEERRQGTDELLLTLPAGDFDIVVGKYLAAGAIFTASLLFSQLSNYAVLASLTLGDLDTGLFFATYFGYWLVGMAMLSVGMVASFLTSNLTVGFILGAAFNAPLVFAANADVIIPSSNWSRLISGWSISSQFDDFGRGVISLSSVAYFLLMIVVGLYLSMVFIGSRHWSGGRDGTSMLGHYLTRTLALMAVALGINFVFSNNDALSNVRRDLTGGKVSSLSPDTKKLIRELKADHTISIEAFISGEVPEDYAKTKSDLVSMLKEFQATATSDINVQIHILDETREESIETAAMAEDRYGIAAQPVRTRTRGAIRDEEVYLAAAFTCGLEKVVVPFFDYGIPVEYELIRSIATVAKKERKKVGIVRTEARLFGGFSFAGGRPQQMPKQALVEELEKQYDVEEIDPTGPVDIEAYDVMIAVQPSSLSPEEFDNVLEAIRGGLPTAIFEDPRPVFLAMAPATGEPKQPPGGGMGGMFGGQQGPQPKGEIQKLWNMLGLEIPGETGMMGLYTPDIAWQKYNPYQKLQIQGIPDSWVFCRPEAPGAEGCINSESPITSGLDEIFFPVPGVVKPAKDSDLKFTELVTTGEAAGTISYQDFMENRENMLMMEAKQGNPRGRQVIAVRVQGSLSNEDQNMSDAGLDEAEAETEDATDSAAETDDAKPETDETNGGESENVTGNAADEAAAPAEPKKPAEIDVVYVADIDLMISAFLRIRARPDEDEEINWNFENVTFLLNAVDVLADDDAFIEIRKRKPRHSTLRMVEYRTQEARQEEMEKRGEFQKKYNDAVEEIEEDNKTEVEKFENKLRDLEQKQRQEGQAGIRLVDLRKAAQDLAQQQELLNRKLEVRREQLSRERDENIETIRRQVDLEILGIKNEYKFWAVALPPIPPLLVGLIVFVQRRLREREGIARSRMR